MLNSSNLNDRVNCFRSVRDIPYHISLKDEPDSSCETKAKLLAQKLKAIGLECRMAECEFNWSDLKLPKRLLELNPQDLDAHAYLEVLIPESGEWVVVDPTWDKDLD